MQVIVDYDPERVVAYLRARAAAQDKKFSVLLRKEMALLVKAGMTALPPFDRGRMAGGSFAGQLTVGKKAVARDISKVFARPQSAFEAVRVTVGGEAGEATAKAFWKMLSARDQAGALDILRASGAAGMHMIDGIGPADEATHRQYRGKDGRVKLKLPRRIATPVASLNALIKVQQAAVGEEKGGFAAAAVRLGAKGIPEWTRKHGTPGVLRDLADLPNDPSIMAQNLDEAAGEHGEFLRIGLRNREQRLKRETEAALRGVWR